jgi:N-acetylglucosaminyldiphosphoundecaprenol N-acetyl-beta-D-mannosaminyltransferase
MVATDAMVFERLAALDTPEQHTLEPASRRPRIDLGGTLVDCVDREQAMRRIETMLWSGKPNQVFTVNLDFLSIAERDDSFRTLINSSALAVADGMPLVWLSRLRRERLSERVAGVELVNDSCELAAQTGHGVFLLGAAPGIAQIAAERLKDRHPGLRVVGTYSPPMGPMKRKENERLVRMIRAASPGFLFVALGAPRQDQWIHENLHALNVPVSMGVGCVLDLLAGVSSRAPRWMQVIGLEWAYRLVREPRRLWRRYILNDLPLFGRLLVSGRRPSGPPVAVPT